MIDEQCRSIQEELQRQIDTEIHDALQRQMDEELQRQIDDALNEEFNRVLDLHNRDVSLANQLDFESMTSIYEDESIAKLLQEYFNSNRSQK